MKRLLVFCVAVFMLFGILFIKSNKAYAVSCPFGRGVNLTNWFQVNSAKEIHFYKYSKTDFEQIKSLGCDVVRLPVNMHFMTNGAPDYTFDPIFLNYLDQVVDWCDDLSMHLIIDNHTFDVDSDTDPNIGAVLEKVWTQLALRYKNANDDIYFEVLNEPHGIADDVWNAIQLKVVEAIRKVNTKHTIIIGPASWNSYNNLSKMPVYNDDKLIYTFHFYDPFLFTHQGASWSNLDLVQHIPFPYNAETMPQCPAEYKGTWVEDNYRGYSSNGTVQKVKQLIDIAVKFSTERNVPIFCGEFGVFDTYSDPAQRVFWYETVREYLEQKNIAWTIWDYHGGFGIFNKNGNNMFEHDLNVPLLEALGFNVPNQTPYSMRPDSVGFKIYTDMLQANLSNSSFGNGTRNFFSESYPNNGEYCIEWAQPGRYEVVGFDFVPNKDLSVLKENNFALSFLVRTNLPEAKIDVRFLDTKTDEPDDHPWRMKYTIDSELLLPDEQWHKVYVPLTSFSEGGSWDGEWFNPNGKFDWTAVDKLEFVAEHIGFGESRMFFDDVVITNLDTAQVRVRVSVEQQIQKEFFAHIENGVLRIEVNEPTLIEYKLMYITGSTAHSGTFLNYAEIAVDHLPKGIYVLYLNNQLGFVEKRKLVIR
ncbi:MAG: glycoside hydrolase family 5 protein [Prolixibacteraceae bacterium]|nr:glycoside hydrolase family 5 protein [Prolixibacteraceae bacterium]